MDRHTFLTGIHERLEPRSYVEIGIRDGGGLARSRTRTIGVDPAYAITKQLQCDLQLVRATSDDFYAGSDPLRHFPERIADFTFIDGMHLFEFALRDFINAEQTSSPASVIILDDMLPRRVSEAARDRHTGAWAGDVYKVAMALEKYRPDLVVLPVDTTPTGVVLVIGLDPGSQVLTNAYRELLDEYVVPDPQPVPDEVFARSNAAAPERVLAAGIWSALIAARGGARLSPEEVDAIRDLRGSATYRPVANPEVPTKPNWPRSASGSAPKPAARRAGAQRGAATGRGRLHQLRKAIKRRL